MYKKAEISAGDVVVLNGNKRGPAAAKEIPMKKIKTEDPAGTAATSQNVEMKKQNRFMRKYRKQLKNLKKWELRELLEANHQKILRGDERMLDVLSDIMTFGAHKPCDTCNMGQLVFNKFGYKCRTNPTDWIKCGAITKDPKRYPFEVPADLARKYPFLKKYKYVPRKRVFGDVTPTIYSPLAKKGDENGTATPKIGHQCLPLYKMEFVVVGNLDGKEDEIKKQILELGGKITMNIKKTVMAVISNATEVEKKGAQIKEAEAAYIQVVSEDFLDEAKKYCGRIPELVTKKSICSWGSDPRTRLPQKQDGGVELFSGLKHCAHVYQSGRNKYTASLRLRNSFCKLQILEADSRDSYWFFHLSGCTDSLLTASVTQPKTSLREAKTEFCHLFAQQTGNLWENRDNFVRVPHRMCPINV